MDKQRGNMMILVIGGVVVLVGALIAVYVMTMKKSGTALPTLKETQVQQTIPAENTTKAATVSSQGSDNLADLDKELNDTSSSLESLDAGTDDVLGISTQLSQ